MSKSISLHRAFYPTLPYTKVTGGKCRDLRGKEIRFRIGNGRQRFLRVCVNGQYRSVKSNLDMTRTANPGWSIGTECYLLNWSHHRRHCWHLSLHFRALRGMRGVTLSYGYKL